MSDLPEIRQLARVINFGERKALIAEAKERATLRLSDEKLEMIHRKVIVEELMKAADAGAEHFSVAMEDAIAEFAAGVVLDMLRQMNALSLFSLLEIGMLERMFFMATVSAVHARELIEQRWRDD